MCARDMVFSPEFKVADADDFGSPTNPQFVYGVVGHDNDSGRHRHRVRQQRLLPVLPADLHHRRAIRVTGVATPKPMIVQAFNTGAGGGKNFDIYMGGRRRGRQQRRLQPAVHRRYPTHRPAEQRRHPRADSASASAAMRRLSSSSIAHDVLPERDRQRLPDDHGEQRDRAEHDARSPARRRTSRRTSITSTGTCCAKRIECPANLTRVTGCKLNSQGLPAADPTAIDMAPPSGKASRPATPPRRCRTAAGRPARIPAT